jgi:ATP-binding cassette subfamily B protein
MSGRVSRNARWIALTTLAKAYPGWFVLILVLSAVNGALPAVFALLVARLVTGLPAAVGSGFGSPAGQSVVTTLVAMGIVLVLQECMIFRGVMAEDHFWRYDGYLLGRIMRTTLSANRLELFEDPILAAKRERGIRFVPASPGEIIAGYEGKWTAVAGGVAATVLVGAVWPVAAMGLAAAWLAFGYTLHGDYLRTREDADDPNPRARYAKELGLLPQWAKEVRVFGLIDWLGDRFGREWLRVMEGLWQARRTHRTRVAYGFGVVLAANAAVLALASHAAAGDRLGVGALTVLVQGMLGMAALADQNNEYLIDMGALPMPAVLGLQAAAAELDNPGGRIVVADRPAKEIRLEDVHFAYPAGDSVVFDRLNLRITAGRSLGIVGLNGAGKTTLIKLLTGLESPSSGRILVDGTDLAELDQQSWRARAAAIFQDFARYELSARDNIGFGAVDVADDAVVLAAATRAGAADLVADLPLGLDTPLSRRFPGGVDLSGGQWQRIALARAIMAVQGGARVLIMDEPTAHLDVRAEAEIYDRFLDLSRGLTTIVISHRFSTVRRADRIVVLDGGRIAEDGSHDELLASDGQYARLFRKQAMRYEDG